MQNADIGLINLKRLYNARLGISSKDDVLPPRLGKDPRPDGASGGVLPDVDKMLGELYELRGWDGDGLPTKQTAARLGLEEEFEALKGAGTELKKE